MKLIHLSDIHLTENGQEIWGVNPLENFRKAIQKIKELDAVDAIVVSGDLSNDGNRWSYKFIDETLASVGIPAYCCPGNHDNLKEFYHGYEPSFYSICEAFELSGWTVLMLNSAVEGMSRGYIDLEKLKQQLRASHGPIAIVLHHPPIEQNGWLNRKLLENRHEFNNLICQAGNVKLVLYGHTHYHMKNKLNGIDYCSSSSIGFAFHPHLPKFEIAHGMEGFNIIEIHEGTIQIKEIRL